MRFLLMAILLAACSGNHQENTVSMQKGCYFLEVGRDSLYVQMTETGEQVKGKIVFDNFEKDGSTGYFTGTLSGDTLKGWYDFESEGMRSVMEMIFLIKGSSLVRAEGNVDVKQDTTFFTNPSSVSFPIENTYRLTDCLQHPVLQKY